MKVPLSVQIGVVSDVIEHVRADPDRADQADTLAAVVATLRWLAAHEPLIKSTIAMVREEAGQTLDLFGVQAGDVTIRKLSKT